MNFYLLMGMLLVFASTSLGALPVFFMRRLQGRFESLLLGLSAGVMLGATFFSLLLPGLEQFQLRGASPLMSSIYMGIGLISGAVLLLGFHALIPHEHFFKVEANTPHAKRVNQQTLLILAVALHNLPEGLAVGVGIASGDAKLGMTLALAIAFQDLPEGWIVAVGLLTLGLSFGRIFLVTALTGVVEAVGVLLGFGALHLSTAFLAPAFALCAGAMLFVVSHEVIPESHRKGYELEATGGVLVGFIMMMILDLGLVG